MKFHNLKLRIRYIFIILIICNIIPTCAGYKTGITRSFACPAILDLQMGGAMTASIPRIINFSPQIVSNKERVFVNVKGKGFDKKSQLLISGFLVSNRYIRVVDNERLIVKVPKGIPVGKYPVLIKNSDGSLSNEVCFEVRS